MAQIVGCTEATISRELKRNSTNKGNYLWNKAHDKAIARRTHTTSNKKLDEILVWKIKAMIKKDWSPEQIKGVLAKDDISVSIQSI
ncbi:MAG: hypothetical protein NC217_05200 [Muribaculaceae bacterium]|nr:hypothetical protein [Muribaculaceae bacterium]